MTAEARETVAFARAVLDAAGSEPGRTPDTLRSEIEGLDTPDRDAILAAVHDAQSRQARLGRRATELEALFSTARELVRLRDVGEVLHRLVERAHALMGTDVTYLSEFEADSGQLRVRYSEGTVTPEFRDLLVPAGFGLASMVARTREPVWVARYDAMDDAPHDPQIDDAVRAEGLVSFLGVPLAVGDEVLGALFACNRFPYESSPDEVLLLSAFADHAAAVLHNARVLAVAEAAKEHAEQSYLELQRHLAATELAGVVHEELTGAVISGGTVVDVVSTLARRLGGRVLALDARGRPLDVGLGADDEDLPPRAALVGAINRSQSSGHAADIRSGDDVWLVTAILGADRVLGAIIAKEAQRLPDDVARRTLERAAHVAALVSFKQDAVTAIRAERRARWLSATIEGGGDARSDPALIAPPTHFTGVAVSELGPHGSTAVQIAERAIGEGGLVALVGRVLVIAWTTGDVLAATERVRQVMADALRNPAIVAVACVRDGMLPTDLRSVVARLTADLDFLPALGVAAATVSSDAFAPYHALAPHDPRTVETFIGDVIGPVLSWDAQRGTVLFDTLAAFFDSGESRGIVAERMHIHVNTVQQRLERVRSLLSEDMDVPEFRFRLQSAVRLERLRRSIRADARASQSAASSSPR
ncbi:helix-turn-helix domain-containing protein [Microbacterium horticulturae]|uniref:Helix-turn-helix domain-containing protein n=1 Tax=Microbacterium horticulturae TaxID=3028316 RepID=A0ABY8C0V9_9MICO|nr:helix-turn-helix domain-containing protein [Microbacterium sp. KACC 23027]WEG08671.1 helix-turn-helix domain-containing protein [Microbacterium sp. KACC 23027]